MERYRISELARRTGTPATTLRFYDETGLLPALRTAAGYRLWDEGAVESLGVIATAKGLGLPLHQIRELLAARRAGPCSVVRDRLRPMLAARIGAERRRADEHAARAGRLARVLGGLAGAVPAGGCVPGCGCLDAGAGHSAEGAPGEPAPAAELTPVAEQAPIAEPTYSSEPAPLAEQAPVACSLAGADLPDRVARWRALVARAGKREPIEGGTRLRLPAALAGQAAELAAAEQACCPFLGFTLHMAGPEVLLDVRAPQEAGPLLARLVTAAEASAAQSAEPAAR